MSKEKRFTIAVLTGTWLPWWSNAALGWGTQTWYGMASIALGGVMPTVVTLWLLHREAMSEKKLFWNRLWQVQRLRRTDWLFLPGLPLLVVTGSIVIGRQLGISEASLAIDQSLVSPGWMIVPAALFILIFGPLPEELGWRGYFLERLLRKQSPWRASFIVAVVWGLWHVPLYFVPGYPLQKKWNEPVSILLYFLALFPISMILTLLFLRNAGSTLMAILFHFFINYTGMLWDTDAAADLVGVGLWCVAIILLYPTVKQKK